MGCRAGLDVGVDNAAGAELAGVQARGLLEPDNHITICLPPLFPDISRQLFSKSLRRNCRIGAELLVVVGTESNDVFVGRQQAIALKRPYPVGSLAAQHGVDLFRDDRSAEHPGKRIPDSDLKFALDALNQPLGGTHIQRSPHLSFYIAAAGPDGSRARPSTHLLTKPWYRPTAPVRHLENCENRIIAGQIMSAGTGSALGATAVHGQRLGREPIRVVVSTGCSGEWRNGRRAGFRCQCPSGRGGSNPPSPTIFSRVAGLAS